MDSCDAVDTKHAYACRASMRAITIGLPLCFVAILMLLSTCLCACSEPWEKRLPEVDRSLLTDDPCRAPCWAGLVPGEATKADVLLALESSPWVKEGSIISRPISVLWEDQGNRFYPWNRAHVRGGYLALIEIQIDFELTLGELVGKFGPPEGVYAYEKLHSYTYTVILDYPTLGMSFTSVLLPVSSSEVLLGRDVGLISPDFVVTEAHYYVPGTLTSVMRDAFLKSPEWVEQILRDEQPWRGFGEVKLAPYGR